MDTHRKKLGLILNGKKVERYALFMKMSKLNDF